MPREKRPAKEIILTEQAVGKRFLIYVNGYRVFVTWSCLQVIKALVVARLDGNNGGYVAAGELNAEPANVRRYVYIWSLGLGDQERGGDPRLRGVKLFETDRAGHLRLTVERDQIKFETADTRSFF